MFFWSACWKIGLFSASKIGQFTVNYLCLLDDSVPGRKHCFSAELRAGLEIVSKICGK